MAAMRSVTASTAQAGSPPLAGSVNASTMDIDDDAKRTPSVSIGGNNDHDSDEKLGETREDGLLPTSTAFSERETESVGGGSTFGTMSSRRQSESKKKSKEDEMHLSL